MLYPLSYSGSENTDTTAHRESGLDMGLRSSLVEAE